MKLRLEKVDLDPLLIKWLEDQGVSTTNKEIIFKPIAGRKGNAGNYYIECTILAAGSVKEEPKTDKEDKEEALEEDLEEDNAYIGSLFDN